MEGGDRWRDERRMSRLGKAAGLIEEGSLYVLLFLLPFAKAAVAIGFVLLLIMWIAERVNSTVMTESIWRSTKLRLLVLVVGVYLGICVLSIFVSDYPLLSIRGCFGKWFKNLLLCMVVADIGVRPNVARRCATVLACSSVLVVIEAITQEMFKRGVFRGYPLLMYGRMTGPYENPGDLATYLIVIVPLLLAYLIAFRPRTSWWLWILLFVQVMCLVRTQTLGAWLGLGAGVFTVLVINPRLRRWGIIIFGLVVIAAGFNLQQEGRFQRIASSVDLGMADRRVMWHAAIDMIRDRPILGHGVNTFMANYLRYWVGGERQPRYAHNCYLQVAAETGLIGLASFLGVLGLLFARLLTVLRRGAPREQLLLLAGLSVGLVAFVVQAAVDTNFYSLRQAALFWVLSGLALGLSCRQAAVTSSSKAY